ncbi:MAG: GAP family protein [Mycobacterium sp.]|uniref:GAP family protein n=1 Tax=Mycobacterium sp. TaxID=1785 RepID=UPI003CBBE1F9
MWGTVLFFALITAMDPQRIGIAAILAGLRRPMHNLFAFWLGLMTAGLALALVGMFLLRDFLVLCTRFLKNAAKSPVVPPVQITFGVLALLIAVAIVVRSSARRAAPAPVPVPVGGPSGFEGDPSGLEVVSKRPNVFSRVFALRRTSWSALLDSGSVKLAFVAGLFTSAPPLEFCGAVLAIVASGAAASTQVSAYLMYMLVGYSIAEIPLVSYLLSPAKTQVVVMRLQGWLRAHQRQIFILILSMVGVLMVGGGVSAA